MKFIQKINEKFKDYYKKAYVYISLLKIEQNHELIEKPIDEERVTKGNLKKGDLVDLFVEGNSINATIAHVNVDLSIDAITNENIRYNNVVHYTEIKSHQEVYYL